MEYERYKIHFEGLGRLGIIEADLGFQVRDPLIADAIEEKCIMYAGRGYPGISFSRQGLRFSIKAAAYRKEAHLGCFQKMMSEVYPTGDIANTTTPLVVRFMPFESVAR